MGAGVVLQSWKQIAEYVGRTERTVQRWELEFGLPVHRPSGKSRSSVMALAQEIEEWTRERPSLPEIRTTARLNRAGLRVSMKREIQNSASAQELWRQSKMNLRRYATLVEKQTQLVEDLHDLSKQRRSLLDLLKRNIASRY